MHVINSALDDSVGRISELLSKLIHIPSLACKGIIFRQYSPLD